MKPKFLSAILIYTNDVERLGSFYRDVLEIPLEEEKHGNSAAHYGCELGELHFAIHQRPEEYKPGPVILALEVFDLDAYVARLVEHNVNIISHPKDHGFAKIAIVEDLDGNRLEFTELSKGWIEHLRARRSEGHDIVSQWDKLNL